jgi:guanosine-3',5'-bis(diphosphate) 3'-pyrophosphohydrolase
MHERDPDIRPLLEAVALAARAHEGQLRKDGRTPYVSHVVRVCLIVRHVFEVEDPAVLTAAVLHDTIEDTTTDFDDIAEQFNEQIAGWVADLSKDKRLKDEPREEAYEDRLRKAGWQVRVCKLADIYDNLSDMGTAHPSGRQKVLKRARHYLAALDAPWQETPPVPGRLAFERAYCIVKELYTELEKAATK